MKFNYKTFDELQRDIQRLGLSIPFGEDLSCLRTEIKANRGIIPNRLATQPMEGCDGLDDGSPGELTFRRYERFAAGGAGLIWLEAVAVTPLGRSNAHQVMITEENVDRCRELVDRIRTVAQETHGHNPYIVIQLTHSGRFGVNKKIVSHYDVLDKKAGLPADFPVMTDEELDELAELYIKAAHLSYKAGFDCVDVKACHRYLLSELLASHLRDGKYGGSYENRTRFFKDVIGTIKNEVDIDLAVRINAYDAIAYPYGWGTDSEGNPALEEPKRFVQELENLGVGLFNITASTPYLLPHITRPYDQAGKFGYEPPEHQLVGVARLLNLAREIQRHIPDSVVVGTGYSWLRHFAPQVAAGVVEQGWAKVIGFGRTAFAYPDFARDILTKGEMDRSKACITCTKCAELKGAGKITGCVVRDPEIYVTPYRELMAEWAAKES